MKSLNDYVTIRAAAHMLGVCEATLRRWDKIGKLKPIRHPINGYRLYKREQIRSLIYKAIGEG
jgi:DNA-binding transcriptional MerR regulator